MPDQCQVNFSKYENIEKNPSHWLFAADNRGDGFLRLGGNAAGTNAGSYFGDAIR